MRQPTRFKLLIHLSYIDAECIGKLSTQLFIFTTRFSYTWFRENHKGRETQYPIGTINPL